MTATARQRAHEPAPTAAEVAVLRKEMFRARGTLNWKGAQRAYVRACKALERASRKRERQLRIEDAVAARGAR